MKAGTSNVRKILTIIILAGALLAIASLQATAKFKSVGEDASYDLIKVASQPISNEPGLVDKVSSLFHM